MLASRPTGAMTQEQIDAWSRLGEQEAAASLPFQQRPAKPKPAEEILMVLSSRSRIAHAVAGAREPRPASSSFFRRRGRGVAVDGEAPLQAPP